MAKKKKKKKKKKTCEANGNGAMSNKNSKEAFKPKKNTPVTKSVRKKEKKELVKKRNQRYSVR